METLEFFWSLDFREVKISQGTRRVEDCRDDLWMRRESIAWNWPAQEE